MINFEDKTIAINIKTKIKKKQKKKQNLFVLNCIQIPLEYVQTYTCHFYGYL